MLIVRKAPSAVLILAFATILSAAKNDFQTGKLISIDSEEKLLQGTSYRYVIISVEVGGVIYSATRRAAGTAAFSKLPSTARA